MALRDLGTIAFRWDRVARTAHPAKRPTTSPSLQSRGLFAALHREDPRPGSRRAATRPRRVGCWARSRHDRLYRTARHGTVPYLPPRLAAQGSSGNVTRRPPASRDSGGGSRIAIRANRPSRDDTIESIQSCSNLPSSCPDPDHQISVQPSWTRHAAAPGVEQSCDTIFQLAAPVENADRHFRASLAAGGKGERPERLAVADRVTIARHVVVTNLFASPRECTIESMYCAYRPIRNSGERLHEDDEVIASHCVRQLVDEHVAQHRLRHHSQAVLRQNDQRPKRSHGYWPGTALDMASLGTQRIARLR